MCVGLCLLGGHTNGTSGIGRAEFGKRMRKRCARAKLYCGIYTIAASTRANSRSPSTARGEVCVCMCVLLCVCVCVRGRVDFAQVETTTYVTTNYVNVRLGSNCLCLCMCVSARPRSLSSLACMWCRKSMRTHFPTTTHQLYDTYTNT